MAGRAQHKTVRITWDHSTKDRTLHRRVDPATVMIFVITTYMYTIYC